ncbi:MAG TPA: NAD(P)-dependent oxidoreductase [Trebonia sp.]|nr:NAD(P)-dependent oxidoreductase [Trebonia sp.]
MRVLVIGASGAVGAHITRQLTERGAEVTGTSRSAQKNDRIRSLGATPVVLDVLDGAATRAVLADIRPDAVIYQATALAGSRFGRSLDKTFAPTNRLRTDGTDNVIAAARSAGVGKLVAQSFAPYRYASPEPVASEDAPLLAAPPASAAVTFAAMAHLDAAVTAAGGIALRYGGFYGAPDQMTAAVARRQYPLVGDGRGMMSFIHLHDAAAATVAALEADGPAIYNITDDEPAPMREWLPVLASALGARPPRRVPEWIARLIMGSGLSMATEARGASNTKAKKELGWVPRYPTWREGFATIAG